MSEIIYLMTCFSAASYLCSMIKRRWKILLNMMGCQLLWGREGERTWLNGYKCVTGCMHKLLFPLLLIFWQYMTIEWRYQQYLTMLSSQLHWSQYLVSYRTVSICCVISIFIPCSTENLTIGFIFLKSSTFWLLSHLLVW